MKKLTIILSVVLILLSFNCDKNNPTEPEEITVKYVINGPQTTDIIYWYDCTGTKQSQIDTYISLPWEIKLAGFNSGDSVYIYSFSLLDQSKPLKVEIYKNDVMLFSNHCSSPYTANVASVKGIIR